MVNPGRKITIDKKNIEDVYALTPLQEGLLFHYLENPTRQRYLEQLCLDISGEIKWTLFKKAWHGVRDTNEMLRTVFRWEQLEKPVQVVLKKNNLQIHFYDYSHKTHIDQKKLTKKLINEDKNKKFNLNQVPLRITLCKTRKDHYKIIFTYHHILLDGWSTSIILSEFLKNYHDLVHQKQLTKPVKNRFKDYVKWLKHQEQLHQHQKKYWKEYLKGFDTPALLPIKQRKDKEQNKENRDRVGTYRIILSNNIKDNLDRHLKSSKITLATLLYSAWGILLQGYTNSRDIILGTTVSGRSAPIEGIENMAGLFINTIPLRLKTYPGKKIKDLLFRTNKDLQTRQAWESTSLVEIKKYSELRHQEELFDSIVVIENYPLPKDLTPGNKGLTIQSYSMKESSNYDLTVIISVFSGIEISLVYDNHSFAEETMVRMSDHFTRIIREITADPGKEIAGLDILSNEEKKVLLEAFNNTEAAYPGEKPIHQLFAEQVQRTPHNIAVVGPLQLKNRTYMTYMTHISYKELNEKSNRLAYLLHQKGVGPDIIAAIMMERSLEMISGLLGILKAGGAYLPIEPGYPQDRIDFMLKDSRTKILLAAPEIQAKVKAEVKEKFIDIIDISDLSSFSTLTSTSTLSEVGSANLAYIIYTSGSTGKPKGVLVDHRSVINILFALHKEYPLRESDTFLLKTAVVFDVSVTELLGWYFGGGRLAILEKDAEKDPTKIINAIENFTVTHINFVPSMFAVFVEALNRRSINKLSSLKYIFLAGEALLAGLLEKFKRFGTGIALENIYGPTEAAIYSSKYSLSHWRPGEIIPIGKPLPNTRLYIVDKDNHLQPIEVPGELCIAGTGVARGYLNKPQLTAEKFDHDLWDLQDYQDKNKNKKIPGKNYTHHSTTPPLTTYKTGDLARWLPDGNIEFLGRLDDQVKIRGFRIELGEIESWLLNHEQVKEAVVVPREMKDGDRYLCAYIVANSFGASGKISSLSSQLEEYLSNKLPGYMIPSCFVELEKIPLTPTGKIDRKELPVPEIKGTAGVYTAPRDEIEQILVKIWSDILGIERNSIGIDHHFFALGGHSLKAVSLVLKIHKELNKKITLEQIFKQPTIRQLSAYIHEAEESLCQLIDPVEEREFYQLSDNQNRLWIINQLEPGNSSYNIVGKIAINHEVHLSALKQAIYTVIERHHSLRTGFKWVDGTPVQWVQKQFTLPLDIVDISHWDEPEKLAHQEELWAKNIRFVFDPGHPPLFRSVLVQLEVNRSEIIFCMHHLISDGWSLEILKQEFFRLYEGYRQGKEVRVEPLRLQYKDAAAWQNKRLEDGRYIKKAKQFWHRIIGQGFGALRLPRDYDLPKPGTEPQGAGYSRVIKKDIAAALKQVAEDNHTSLFVVMCSAFNILLSYLSDQRQIFCGIPGAGREHVSLQHIVGFFLNTLVMKSPVHEEERFIDYMHRVSSDTIAALQYQGYPLERILGDLKMSYPVIPVMFNMLNMQEIQVREAPGALDSTHLPRVQDVKNDINIYITEYINNIEVSWHYRKKMFKPETIEYMTGEYLNLLQAISINPRQKIKYYQVCSRKSIRVKGNSIQPTNEFKEFKKEAIHQSPVHRFEEQAAYYPWNTAVKTRNSHFTYKELNTLANQAAHGILAINSRKRGVALLFEHDIHMIVGMLATLKTGNFYVPLDPGYPAKRLIYMLKDSNVNILLTNNLNKTLAGELIREAGNEIRLVNLSALPPGTAKENLEITISPGDPAYILYTSGSTGIPKGVVQNHRSILHFIRVYTNQLHIHTGDRLTLFSSYSFDAAVMDIYGALCNGAALYPFDIKQEEHPGRLSSWLRDEKITIFHSIPTVFRYFTDLLTGTEKFSAIRFVVMGGEAVYQQDVEKYKKHFPDNCLFINGLGPTESTVTLQYFIDKKMEITRQAVPVGYPVEETSVYLLKDNNEEARIYEKGEITFKSDYLAMGYLNQQEKTSEVFTVNPLTNSDKIYRTGDLGIRLPDGAIEYLGRKDDQVKIRGYRVELGEIESILHKVAGIKKSVVVSRQTSNRENYLAVYYQAGNEKQINENNLRNILIDSLPGFMIPRVFIRLEDFPLTPTGKIHRQALPGPDETHILAAQTYPYGSTAPGNQIEEKMVHIWKHLLDIKRIGTEANFFQSGGHSLTATLLTARIFKEFNVKIPLKEIFLNPTIKELSKYINESVKAQYKLIKAAEKMEYYPLSSGQKRLYILHQMAAASVSYNISNAFVLEGNLDIDKLEAAFCQLTRRHESLRTSFKAVNGEPVQQVYDEVEFKIEYYDMKQVEVEVKVEEGLSPVLEGTGGLAPLPMESAASTIKNFIRPFDISQAPLLRLALIKTQNKRYILVIDVHHIIADGMSLGIIARDLTAMYHGKTLPGLSRQYRDYSQWHNNQTGSAERKQQEKFWLKEFPGELPILNLPTDFKRPDIQNFEGGSLSFEMGNEDTERLKTLASEKNATLFMVLFSLYNVWLSKISGQEDIIVGTPAAGRSYPGLENITGMFVNTLALRNYPSGEQTFEEFLKKVRQGILPAYENQDYPFEDLVEHLWQHRDSSRNPLFDVMFTFQNLTGPGMEIPGLTLTPYPYRNQISKFDINLDSIDKGGSLAFTLQYGQKLFKKSTIETYARYFNHIVSSILADPGKTLGSIEIITEADKSEILNHFNDTAVKYPPGRAVKVLFEEQVSKTPRETAAVFTGETLNYRQLNEKANQLARRLMARGIGTGALVPVLMDQSLELLISFLALVKVGAAFIPIDVRWPIERIKMIRDDIEADIVLVNPSTPYNRNQLDKETIMVTNDGGEYKIRPDKGFSGERRGQPYVHPVFPDRRLPVDPESPIYVMYTSGSTGKPKGVMIPQRGITNRLLWMNDYFGIETAGVVLQTTRYVYDSVVWQFFWPLINGGKTIILPPDFVMSADRIAYLVETYQVTITDFVPSVFTIIVDQLLEDPRFQGKLKSLQEVVLGAEEIIPAAVYKFIKAFPGIRLTNLYGPTEATIGCIYHPVTGDEGDKIPIGRPISNVRVYIMDLYMKIVPVGIVGEIFIAGPGLGLGYVNEIEKTAKVFLDTPFSPGKNLYRTGDLGKWRPDGRIDFLGRIDHQVKIRGVRIELAEIENILLAHKDIKDAVVIVREKQKDDKYLCAYIVPPLNPESENELRAYLAGELPVYMIPNYYVQLERIPLTPAGKVDRKALPDPEFTKPGQEYLAPRNETEERLVLLVAEVLGIEPNAIGVDNDFFELGGHSLKAVTLIAKIHQVFNVKVPLLEIFKIPIIMDLARFIKGAGQERFMHINPTAQKEYYALSSAQKRLFILQQLEEKSTFYNMPGAVVLEGMLDKERLEKTLKKLINRHESLRTSFVLVEDQAVQKPHQKVEFQIEYYDLVESAASTINNFIRPFELSQAPLLRVGLVKETGNRHILMFDMHHIVSDGVSQTIFIKEFMQIYNGRELPLPRFQYRDYSQWQNSHYQQKALKNQEKYWLKEIAAYAPIPLVNLPTDYPRPAVQSFAGARIEFSLDKQETTTLKKMASKEGVTLFILILTLYNILLSKLGGQEEVVVGTAAAGRQHADLQQIIGVFVNFLVLINRPSGEKSINAFLKEVREKTLAAFENQDYPFEDLVNNAAIERDVSRNPMFDAMFIMQNQETIELDIPGLKLSPYDYDYGIAQLDLKLQAYEGKETLSFTVDYCTKLFNATTIHRFIQCFKKIIQWHLENPAAKIGQIEIIPEAEKSRILMEFNAAKMEYPRDKAFNELFIEQVKRTPGTTALVGTGLKSSSLQCREKQLSYNGLNEASTQLSRLLRAKGVKPDSIVGILVERSPELMISIMAVLGTGAAYLPINPGYPGERIDYMLTDSSAGVLVTTGNLVEDRKIERWEGEKIFLKSHQDVLLSSAFAPSSSTSTSTCQVSATNLAYVIYTSGSTGKPKGVMIRNGNVANFVTAMRAKIRFVVGKRLMALAPISFDLSVSETLVPLSHGLTLVIANETEQKDPEQLKEALIKKSITMLHVTPSRLQLLINCDSGLDSLKHIEELMVGGEAFPDNLFKNVKTRYNGKLYNLYGPTEATVWATLKDLTGVEINTIGKPIANTSVAILDKNCHIQPIGVVGEIGIGGDGLAGGYLNNPELTAEKFILNRSYRSNTSYISSKRIYKTGDLGRWFPDGNIQCLGRIDHQVKVRGYRIELGEIESLLLKHDDIKEALVICRNDKSGDRYLCAYIVPDTNGAAAREKTPDRMNLKEYLSGALPDYMIPSYFVLIDRIPLTPNGKIDRKTLPSPGIKGTAEAYMPPRNEIEKQLVKIWSGILAKDALHASQMLTHLGIDDNFFELGGHSLSATTLASKIHKEFNVKIPLIEIFKISTIRELSRYIQQAAQNRCASIQPVEKKEYYKLSSAQKRLYVIRQMEEDSTAYNNFNIVEMDGALNIKTLEKVFHGLIERHESFRTTFDTVDDEPVQKVHEEVEFAIEYFNLATEDTENTGKRITLLPTIKDFIHPFDLSQAPLLRVGLIKKNSQKHILVVDMHHIISDGTSYIIMVEDFMSLYNGEELPPLKLRYKDYSEWRNRWHHGKEIKKQEEFWLKEFSSEVPILNLPMDFSRPLLMSTEGAEEKFVLPAEETEKLKILAAREDSTLFMILLSIYYVFLSKLSSQEDLVVGAPVAGRRQTELEDIIGMFVNTLALRNYPREKKTFRHFLKEIRKRTLEAYENQDYPLEDLVEKARFTRDSGGNPLFDVMFTFQNINIPELKVPGLMVKAYEYENPLSKLDLNLVAAETREKLTFTFNYCRKLFQRKTIIRFTRYFKTVVSSVLADPGQELGKIEIVGEEEKNKIINVFNDTKVSYPIDKAVKWLFEEQVKKTPYLAAAAFKGRELNYLELNEKANDLAHQLQLQGVGKGMLVPVLMDHSLELLISFLAITKTGAAFVPVDVKWPVERVKSILADLGQEPVLINTFTPHWFADSSRTAVMVDVDKLGRNQANPKADIDPEDIIYVMYTSGSTGKPKGVVVAHRGISNRLFWMNDYFGAHTSKVVLQTTRYVYDSVVWQFFWPLMNGGQTIVLSPDFEMEALNLANLIETHHIRIVDFVPSVFTIIVDQLAENEQFREKLKSLTDVILGGEEIIPPAVYKFKKLFQWVRVTNLYGPTETTIGCVYHPVAGNEGNKIPIGQPISNVFIYIMTRHMRLLPIGVPGEIFIAGIGVGLGYLNNQEKTGNVFLDHPFSPGKMMYRTGDLGRRLPGGRIDFLGRIDYQVKIRGLRLELKEIESQLLNYKGIKETVVIDRQDETGEKYLCAYIVPEFNIHPHPLKEYLKAKLPGYMVPSHIVFLPRIPLTPGGKLDRKALPEPVTVSRGMTYVSEEMLKKAAIPTGKGKNQPDWPDFDGEQESHGGQRLTGEKRNQILYTFNQTEKEYPREKLIYQLFEEQAAKTPYNIALVNENKHLAYDELNKKTNRFARLLRSRGVKADSIVGMMVGRSLEMVVGIMGILKAGGAFMPIDLESPELRQVHMIEDVKPVLILANPSLKISRYNSITINPEDIKNYKESNTDLPPVSRANNLSHVLFTSGTTGIPKAIPLENRSMINVMSFLSDLVSFLEVDNVASLTPITFDLFTADTLLPLTRGSKVVIGSREALLDEDAAALILEREKITIYRSNPSGLQRLVGDEKNARVIRGLKCLLIAGEPLLEPLLQRLKRLTPALIYNLYGPAEVAMYSTAKNVTGSNSLNIGKPIANIRVYILSRSGDLQPIAVAGELCIAGVGLARGYLNNPELTAQKFCLRRPGGTLFEKTAPPEPPRKNFLLKGTDKGYMQSCNHASMGLSTHHSPHSPIYHTGDLGQWLPDGNIEFIGRIDHQVKVGGIRIEPGEIESCLLLHHRIKEAAVIVKENKNKEKYLCACLISGELLLESDIRKFISDRLPHYMIPLFFVQLERMPLTPNRKIDRKRLAFMQIDPEPASSFAAPRNQTEKKLQQLWSEILGLTPGNISIDANFFELGGHSLRAVVVISRIHKNFNVKVPLAEIFKSPTIRELSRYIDGALKDLFFSIEPLESSEYYELSFIQKRLWFLHQMNPESPTFNIVGRIVLTHSPDPDRLKTILRKMIERHESLRTGFKVVDEEPVQYLVSLLTLPLQFIDISSLAEEEKQHKREEVFIEEAARKFDLSRPPFFQSILLKIDAHQYDLIFNMHHIISDGWSLDILEREFYLLYDGYGQRKYIALEPLKIQYKDFAAWQNRQLTDSVWKEKSHRFWSKKLAKGIPVMELPGDFSKDNNRNTAANFRNTVPKELKDRLKNLAEINHTSLFMVLFSAYVILLSHLSDQQDQDIVCWVISAGREHIELQNIVGCFVNSLMVKTRVDSEDTFTDLLRKVENDTLEALQHQGYPLELLCEELKIKYPDIPVAFNMLNLPDTPLKEMLTRETDKSEVFERNIQDALFELEPYVAEYKNSIEITWRYKKTVFKPETIEKIAQGYLLLLEEISWTEEE